jgi:hypothetical protein
VESLAECPATMTHASVPIEQRVLLGGDNGAYIKAYTIYAYVYVLEQGKAYYV